MARPISPIKHGTVYGYRRCLPNACRPCMDASQVHQKERYEARKELVYQAKDKPCADCGVAYPPYVMDFDHVHGEKKFPLTEAFTRMRPIKDVEAEIAKCEVVCANCHRQRTYGK